MYRLASVGAASVISVILGGVCAIGCSHERGATPIESPTKKRSLLYDRVHAVFQHAVYFKPRDEDVEDQAFALPPLILQEIDPADPSSAMQERFGAVNLDADSGVLVDTSRPTVYTARAFATLRGREYEQALCLWFYAGSADSERATISWQGFRMTLDAGGFPIVWEALSDIESVAQVFVSESLESASAAAVGPPLTGRRFSVERSLEDRPDVIVSRILADGPMPMGPWVYLRAGDRAICTIICRCMPSQVKDIAQTAYYEIAPLSTLGELGTVAGTRTGLPASPDELNYGVPEMADSSWLEHALRLPPEF